jgi:hypothetical protein
MIFSTRIEISHGAANPAMASLQSLGLTLGNSQTRTLRIWIHHLQGRAQVMMLRLSTIIKLLNNECDGLRIPSELVKPYSRCHITIHCPPVPTGAVRLSIPTLLSRTSKSPIHPIESQFPDSVSTPPAGQVTNATVASFKLPNPNFRLASPRLSISSLEF